MTFPLSYQRFAHFYKSCDKPTFWFCLLELNQIIGFTPSLPSVALYVAIILYAIYVLLRQGKTYNWGLMLLLAYIPIALFITTPNEVFRSWERYVLFALLLICVSPLLTSKAIIRNRRNMFRMLLIVCTIIGIGSFFAKFIGINFMGMNRTDIISQVGLFGGLTTHSMLLGPIASISALYMAYLAYLNRNKFYWLLSVLSIITVMFSASRSALAAMVAGMTIMLFRMSGSVNKFVITAVVTIMVGMATFPLWGSAMDAIIEKNEGNKRAGSAINSRDFLWETRIYEFHSSPVFGIGFAASLSDSDFDNRSGMIESGSSWLIILSMTGLLGAVMIVPVLFKAYFSAYRDKDKYSALVCGVLTLFFVHMIAEGYIYYGGSQMAFMLWLTIGVAMDCRYSIKT